MRDVKALRRQFARHALGQPAQRELAHRERRRLRIALDAGGGAGETGWRRACWAACAGPPAAHQEAAERADRDRLRHLGRHQIDERAARPRACIIDYEIRRADLAFDQAEQPFDLFRIGCVAGIGVRAGLAAERAELLDLARGKRDVDLLAGE